MPQYINVRVTFLICFIACAIFGTLNRVNATEVKNDDAGLELTTSKDWFTLSDHLKTAFNESLSRGVKLHAEKLGVELKANEVSNRVIVVQSKTLFGAAEDNPNIVVAIEKVWTDRFEKSGKGYRDLMADRVRQLGSPIKFTSKPEEVKIAERSFFVFDAENLRASEVNTNQRYIAGFNRGHYVLFVLTYNKVDDDDFRMMMEIVQSVKLKK